MKPRHVVFASYGGTGALSEAGEQMSELQRPWFLVYIEFLERQGLTPEEIKAIQFTLPSCERAYPFRTPNGWNWDFRPRPDITEEQVS